MSTKKLIIAGGGTGGHVLAGVVIAQEWIKKSDHDVYFVGACGGIEEKLVPRAGFKLFLLTLGSLKGVSFLTRLRTLVLLPHSFLKSAILLIRYKPDAVMGVGGYASGPLVLISRLLSPILRCKVAILEQNAVPGLTNRILGKLSHKVFLAFPGLEPYFGCSKTEVSGNPVRAEFKLLPTSQESKFTVFIFGGSQGAQGINTLVLDSLEYLKDLKDQIFWIHQTGEKDLDRVLKGHQAQGTNSRVEKFIYDMGDCYQKAHLIICRAGSSTLSEIATVGRAAVFIPFPYASDDHQTKNAKIFENAEAAIVLEQFKSNGEMLAQMIRNLYTDRTRLILMQQKANQFSKPDAAKTITQYFEGH